MIYFLGLSLLFVGFQLGRMIEIRVYRKRADWLESQMLPLLECAATIIEKQRKLLMELNGSDPTVEMDPKFVITPDGERALLVTVERENGSV